MKRYRGMAPEKVIRLREKLGNMERACTRSWSFHVRLSSRGAKELFAVEEKGSCQE